MWQSWPPGRGWGIPFLLNLTWFVFVLAYVALVFKSRKVSQSLAILTISVGIDWTHSLFLTPFFSHSVCPWCFQKALLRVYERGLIIQTKGPGPKFGQQVDNPLTPKMRISASIATLTSVSVCLSLKQAQAQAQAQGRGVEVASLDLGSTRHLSSFASHTIVTPNVDVDGEMRCAQECVSSLSTNWPDQFGSLSLSDGGGGYIFMAVWSTGMGAYNLPKVSCCFDSSRSFGWLSVHQIRPKEFPIFHSIWECLIEPGLSLKAKNSSKLIKSNRAWLTPFLSRVNFMGGSDAVCDVSKMIKIQTKLWPGLPIKWIEIGPFFDFFGQPH